jgi:ubiquinone/menaquinone biosynthesis C-methylase UbiE
VCSTLPPAAASCPTSLAKLGYQVTGVDVCEDLLAMARQRIREDRHLRVEPQFVVADIEAEPIKYGEFEAAIFESCFHHFQNPIAALRHVAASLAPEGVVVLTESECRQGPLKEEWVASMYQYQDHRAPIRQGAIRPDSGIRRPAVLRIFHPCRWLVLAEIRGGT